jgi:plastocyanin
MAAGVSPSGSLAEDGCPAGSVGCGTLADKPDREDERTSGGTREAAMVVVRILKFAFGPAQLTVAPGTTITWTNADSSPHQVSVKGTALRTRVILKGQTASLTFNEPGTYEYTCGPHASMKGTIEVK